MFHASTLYPKLCSKPKINIMLLSHYSENKRCWNSYLIQCCFFYIYIQATSFVIVTLCNYREYGLASNLALPYSRNTYNLVICQIKSIHACRIYRYWPWKMAFIIIHTTPHLQLSCLSNTCALHWYLWEGIYM